MAARTTGTHNAPPAFVGDGAGAPKSSSAAVAPKLEKVAKTIMKMARKEASFEPSITLCNLLFSAKDNLA